jgi:hypothetical protein
MVWKVDQQDAGGRVLDNLDPVDTHAASSTLTQILLGVAQGIGGPIAPALKHFGEQGWELAGIDTSSSVCALYILKRPQQRAHGSWRRFFRWLRAAD